MSYLLLETVGGFTGKSKQSKNQKVMKTIKCYWESHEFDLKKGWITITHPVEFEVADNTTDEEIENIADRKDVIIIK